MVESARQQARDAVVLAGGAGLRLRPLTEDVPKPMITVAGKPLLFWILVWLRKNGIQNVVVGIAHKGEKIVKYFKNGSELGLNISYSRHTVSGGTAQGFRLAIERYVDDKTFLAMNGDQLTDLRLQKFVNFHRLHKRLATIAFASLRSPYGLGNIRGTLVRTFGEKPTVHKSMGVYAFNREIIEYLPERGDIETHVFPRLAEKSKLTAYTHHGFWMTADTEKDLLEMRSKLKRQRIRDWS